MQKRSVYFIQEGKDGPIKIGISDSPAKRLRLLQCGNPRKLRKILSIPDSCREDEKELHKMFAHLRLVGEWFKPEKEILDYVENQRKMQPNVIIDSITNEDFIIDPDSLITI